MDQDLNRQGESDEHMDIDVEDVDTEDDDDLQVIPAPNPFRYSLNRVQSFDRPNGIFFNNDPVRPSGGNIGRFVQDYRVLSARNLGNTAAQQSVTVENGGKLILPQDALAAISRRSTDLLSPMLFKVTNQANGKSTHCGVLEFTAEDNLCYMPTWMMDYLEASDRDTVRLEKVNLPTAEFVKFQAQSVDFLEITDQRAILENSLRQFACLTTGDMIAINYNGRAYKLCVLETKPAAAVTIIECNLNVDFEAPVGYVSPSASDSEQTEAGDETVTNPNAFTAFVGSGNRLNGKTVETPGAVGNAGGGRKTMPDTDWKIGNLVFKRKFRKTKDARPAIKHNPFGGIGLSLKSAKK